MRFSTASRRASVSCSEYVSVDSLGMIEPDMPHPLSRVKPDAELRIRASVLPPDLCVHVTRTLSAWSYADHIIGTMLANFLDADFEVVSSMYEALTSAEAKRAVLLAAANSSSPDDYPLVQAVFSYVRASRKTRNAFAHHVWLTSPDLPCAMILADPKVLTDPAIRIRGMAKRGELQPKTTHIGKAVRIEMPQMPVPDRSKMIVYKEKDLADAAQWAEVCLEAHIRLSKACSRSYPDAEARQTLLNEPQIAREVQRLSR